MLQTRYLRTLEATTVLLFIVQSVRVLFSVLFGLIYDVIFAETVAFTTLGLIMACVFAAFLTPLVAPRRRSRTLMFGTAVVAALARVVVTINLAEVRLWSSIVLIAAGGVYAAVSAPVLTRMLFRSAHKQGDLPRQRPQYGLKSGDLRDPVILPLSFIPGFFPPIAGWLTDGPQRERFKFMTADELDCVTGTILLGAGVDERNSDVVAERAVVSPIQRPSHRPLGARGESRRSSSVRSPSVE